MDRLSCHVARRMHGLARTESLYSMRAMPDTSRFEAIDHLTSDELRQRLRSLQALIASAPVPIAIAHDPDCRFISANLALATLLGVPLGRNISMTPADGSPPPYRIQRDGKDLPDNELPMQLAIAHRASISNDIEILRSDGTVAYVQNDVEPLYDTHGEVYGCVSVCVDLTEQKLAQLALIDWQRTSCRSRQAARGCRPSGLDRLSFDRRTSVLQATITTRSQRKLLSVRYRRQQR